MHLQFKLNKPINEVFQCLSIAKNFELVHPVIYKIEPQANENHLVYEQLRIGFIKFKFTYPCTIEANIETKTITMKAWVIKMVHIEIIFKLTAVNGQTIVDEFTSFKSFLPVGFVMGKIFSIQHKQLFINIEKLELNRLVLS